MSCKSFHWKFHESQLQVALSLQGGGRHDKSPSKATKRKKGRTGSFHQAARGRTADMLSRLTFKETKEIMRSRERPLEDPGFKEVEEIVGSRWWGGRVSNGI